MKFKKVCMLMSIIMAMSSVTITPIYASGLDESANVESIAENAPLEAKEWVAAGCIFKWDGVDTLKIGPGEYTVIYPDSPKLTPNSPTFDLVNSSSMVKNLIIEEGITEIGLDGLGILSQKADAYGKINISLPSTLVSVESQDFDKFTFGDVIIPDSVTEFRGSQPISLKADSLQIGSGLDVGLVRSILSSETILGPVTLSSTVTSLVNRSGFILTSDETNLIYTNNGAVLEDMPSTVNYIEHLGTIECDELILPVKEGEEFYLDSGALSKVKANKFRLNEGVTLVGDGLKVGYVKDMVIPKATGVLSNVRGTFGTLVIEDTLQVGLLYGKADKVVLPNAVKALNPSGFEAGVIVLPKLEDLGYLSGYDKVILQSPTLKKTQNLSTDIGATEVIIENATSIPDNAFNDSAKLQNVVLNEGTTSIGLNAFKGTGVKFSELPDTITEVKDSAFEGTNLSLSKLPSAINTIGNLAFANTKDVRINKIPNTVSNIGDNAFENTSIEYLKIEQGTSPVTIGANAFAGCDKLSEIILPSNINTIGENAFKANMTVNTNLYSDSIATDAYDWVASNRRVTSDSYENAPAPTYNITINIDIFTNGIGEDVKMSWDGLTWTKIPVGADGNISIKAPEGATKFYLKSGTTIITVKLTNNGSTVGDIILDEDVSNGGTSSDVDAEGDNIVNVDFSKKSSFKVRIPSQLHADETGKVAYKVGVMGELESMSKVNIVPQDKIADDEGTSFFMENGKGGQINTKVNLDKQSFSATDVLPDTWTYGNGLVSMTDVKPGVWNGSFVLNVNLSE